MSALQTTILLFGICISLGVGMLRIEKAIDRNSDAVTNMFEVPACVIEGKK